jgi:hypothetical protein
MTQDIHSEVLNGIRRAAKTDCPGDQEMQQHVIDSESEAYQALQALDFGEALPFKQAILDEASQVWTGAALREAPYRPSTFAQTASRIASSRSPLAW